MNKLTKEEKWHLMITLFFRIQDYENEIKELERLYETNKSRLFLSSRKAIEKQIEKQKDNLKSIITIRQKIKSWE